MKKKRKVRKYDVYTSIDGRRQGLTIQVLVRHRDGTCTVKNDLGRKYRVLTRRLNGHGHWKFIRTLGGEANFVGAAVWNPSPTLV